MAERPPAGDAAHLSGPKTAGSKPAGNPALRMMGIPNFNFKLPSRNWLIFWAITGSFTSTLLYDRYQKKRAQQKWCNLVSHLAEESLPPSMMPRRITIFLAAPPGDSIRAAREHFHEYVKPILVAGALDWDVIEGRREGEVRAGLAEKIRKLRKRKREKPLVEPSEENTEEESPEDLMYALRQKSGTSEWDGVQGDLILGRHTWKEYIRGLHEGWLGPLDLPTLPQTQDTESQPSDASLTHSPSTDTLPPEADSDSSPQTEPPAPDPPPVKAAKPTPTPPYITPADYPSCPTPSFTDLSISPSLPLPLPHLLGFFNTPTRLYRFLTRRQLADSTGRSVAALVLASHDRNYTQSAEFASIDKPDDASPSVENSAEMGFVALAKETWEQEEALKGEEKDWHKSAWKAKEEGEVKERVWQEAMVIDSRIGQRMRHFELASGEAENALRVDAQKKQEVRGLVERARKWTGWTKQERQGWDMGLEGDENE